MERQAKDLVSDGFNLTYLELKNPSSISYNLYSTTFGEHPSIFQCHDINFCTNKILASKTFLHMTT